MYDDDVYGARIIAEGPSAEGDEEYNVVCNHLIGDAQFNFSHIYIDSDTQSELQGTTKYFIPQPCKLSSPTTCLGLPLTSPWTHQPTGSRLG